MIVTLYRVGRNLNRAVRTCEAFGVRDLHLLECHHARLSGHLFGATGRVHIETIEDWPDGNHVCALETHYPMPIYDIPWHECEGILIGGETAGLPSAAPAQYHAHIPMVGRVSGLTVEAALAIALYEWRRQIS